METIYPYKMSSERKNCSFIVFLKTWLYNEGEVISMSDIINSKKEFSYTLDNKAERHMMFITAKALASKERLEILSLLEDKPLTISEIAKLVNIPKSSVAMHTAILQEAQLIFIDYKPGPKGQIKLCSRLTNKINFSFENTNNVETVNEFSFEMPIGNYFDFKITPPCGLAGIDDAIGNYDEIATFCLPERFQAQLLWFQSGFVSYRFPTLENKEAKYEEISFTLEFCSETVYSRNDWPSDITFWINGKEIATFTSPGDFGGRRGKYTPKYWFINSTQFGLVKTFSVNKNGCYIDNVLTSKEITLADLHLDKNSCITFSVGVKEDAIHKGGINIFGKNFGDFNHDIIMKITYK